MVTRSLLIRIEWQFYCCDFSKIWWKSDDFDWINGSSIGFLFVNIFGKSTKFVLNLWQFDFQYFFESVVIRWKCGVLTCFCGSVRKLNTAYCLLLKCVRVCGDKIDQKFRWISVAKINWWYALWKSRCLKTRFHFLEKNAQSNFVTNRNSRWKIDMKTETCLLIDFG